MIVTSGTGVVVTPGRLATEDDAATSPHPRVASEQAAAAVAARGVRVSVVRLPPSVHGDGDYGFVPRIIAVAREKGVSAYVGDGLNRWPAVHRLDGARLYRLVLEKGAAGARYHGIGDEGVPIREIAEVIGPSKRTGCCEVPGGGRRPFRLSRGVAEYRHSGFRRAERLGWRPTQPGLIADLDDARYFKA